MDRFKVPSEILKHLRQWKFVCYITLYVFIEDIRFILITSIMQSTSELMIESYGSCIKYKLTLSLATDFLHRRITFATAFYNSEEKA